MFNKLVFFSPAILKRIAVSLLFIAEPAWSRNLETKGLADEKPKKYEIYAGASLSTFFPIGEDPNFMLVSANLMLVSPGRYFFRPVFTYTEAGEGEDYDTVYRERYHAYRLYSFIFGKSYDIHMPPLTARTSLDVGLGPVVGNKSVSVWTCWGVEDEYCDPGKSSSEGTQGAVGYVGIKHQFKRTRFGLNYYVFQLADKSETPDGTGLIAPSRPGFDFSVALN
ncbi:MAG: hypothetical protein AB7T49_02910 [Oligoflexales bacterium]